MTSLNLIIFLSGITSYFDSQGKIRDFFKIRMSILSVLVEVGMSPSLPKLVQAGPPEVLSVLLDGRIVGSISASVIEKVVAHLRRLKVSTTSGVCPSFFVFFSLALSILASFFTFLLSFFLDAFASLITFRFLMI